MLVRTAWALVAMFALVAIPTRASAQALEGPTALTRLTELLAACPSSLASMPEADELASEGVTFSLTPDGDAWRASFASWGMGVESEGGGWDLWLHGCDQVLAEWSGADGVLGHTVRVRTSGPGLDEAMHALVGATYDPHAPAHGLAALIDGGRAGWWCGEFGTDQDEATPPASDAISTGVVRGADATQLRRPGEPGTPVEIRVRTPDAEVQPWLSGPPRASVMTFFVEPCAPDQDGVCGSSIPAFGTPVQNGTLGAYERWEVPLEGRNGGLAIAERDVAGDRHRWVMVSRGCANATTLRWLGEGAGVSIAEGISRHGRYGDALVVFDPEAGTGQRLDVPNAFVGDEWSSVLEEGQQEPTEAERTFWLPRVEGGALVVRSLGRAERRVPLTEIAAAARRAREPAAEGDALAVDTPPAPVAAPEAPAPIRSGPTLAREIELAILALAFLGIGFLIGRSRRG